MSALPGRAGTTPRLAGTRPSRSLVYSLRACLLLLLLAACEHATTLIDPTAPADTTVDDGTVQKATLTVSVALTGNDSLLASLVGCEGGLLPDAEVTIERSGTPGSLQSATTDAAGWVRFERLLPGTYAVSVIRVLTPEEVTQFPGEDADVNAFGGAARTGVLAPSTDMVVQAVAGRRGSLVISEFSVTVARLASGNDYVYGDFIELYNNSDTTIYLDGKVLVRGFIHGARGSDASPCDVHEPWQNDPEGIWTRYIEAFPGAGRNHPLAPGRTAVVATDAIDHREFHPDLQDLSRAEFEFIGPADVDNPSAANMRTLGEVWGGGILTHGLDFGLTDVVTVVANPVDVGSLPQENIPLLLSPEHWRIPGEKILDVLTASPTPAQEANMTFLPPQCPRYIHENFDRQRAAVLDPNRLGGVQRRLFATLPDGRKILLRTKTSSSDFVARYPATPGFIPE
jgi:hypothetical protein